MPSTPSGNRRSWRRNDPAHQKRPPRGYNRGRRGTRSRLRFVSSRGRIRRGRQRRPCLWILPQSANARSVAASGFIQNVRRSLRPLAKSKKVSSRHRTQRPDKHHQKTLRYVPRSSHEDMNICLSSQASVIHGGRKQRAPRLLETAPPVVAPVSEGRRCPSTAGVTARAGLLPTGPAPPAATEGPRSPVRRRRRRARCACRRLAEMSAAVSPAVRLRGAASGAAHQQRGGGGQKHSSWHECLYLRLLPVGHSSQRLHSQGTDTTTALSR